MRVYRFSVAWPRVQADGSGPALAAGLDHYERTVDGCLARGLTPLPTLYHWDLPQALEDAGGWPVRATAERFAEYAGLVAARLGDRVHGWATLNEPWCSAFLGYAAGVHAPGRQEPAAAFAAAHHLLLAHALGAEAVRAAAPGADVGVVLNLMPALPEPGHEAAAAQVEAVQNLLWLDALLDGRYPVALPELHRAGLVRDGDLELIHGSAQWLGVNYYTPLRPGPLRGSDDSAAWPGSPPFTLAPRGALTTMDWEVHPQSLGDVLVGLSRRAPGLPLLVTENGSAYPDAVRAADGSVDDPDRVAYLRGHLAAVHAAREQGADVRAYVAWTLLDNFEWALGYTQRFGLVEVAPGTLERVPKASFRAYREIAHGTTSS